MVAVALAFPALGPAKWLWCAALCGYAVLLLKLWYERLHTQYPFFSGYVAYHLVRGLVLISVPFNSNAYARIWGFSAPIGWVLYILVVLELYSLVLRNYKGIASLGRWTLMGALVISVLISSLTLFADLSNPAERFPTFLIFNAIERGVISSLAIFLLLITVFLAAYPVPLSRNVIVHSIVYAVYFLSMTMGLLVRNIAGIEVHSTVNLLLMGVADLCIVIWIVSLSRKGESRTVVLRQHWRLEDEEHLMEQLGAINSTLLRVARK